MDYILNQKPDGFLVAFGQSALMYVLILAVFLFLIGLNLNVYTFKNLNRIFWYVVFWLAMLPYFILSCLSCAFGGVAFVCMCLYGKYKQFIYSVDWLKLTRGE